MSMLRNVVMVLCLVAVFALSAHAAAPQRSSESDSVTADALRDRSEVFATAKKIDDLIAAKWAELKIKPERRVSDDVFMRRAYLDIVGRIPTLQEAHSFLKSRKPEKRADLVDELLYSEGYVKHFFNYWADVLRIKTDLNNNVNGTPYIAFIKDSLRDGKPYDKMVFEMLTAEGRIWEDGAAGYYLRDTGMPLDNMANTLRIFLGTSIGCAQCHDHPFDKWSQLEFYEMAAFTFGVQTRARGMNLPNGREVERLANEQKVSNRILGRARAMLRANNYAVSDNDRMQLRLPDDYKYDDARPRDVVHPLTIFGDAAPRESGMTPRVSFASWLTSRENPRFTLNIANRMWKQVMGYGLIEPVDEIMDDTKPSNPELMQVLIDEMKKVDYDVREFLRVVYNTQAYQLASLTADLESMDDYHYQGRLLRRMSAEQLWDSLVTMVTENPDAPTRQYAGRYSAAIDLEGMTAQQVLDLAKKMDSEGGGMMMMAGGSNDGMQSLIRGPDGPMARAADLQSPANPSHFLAQFGQSDREQIEAASTDPNQTQVLSLLNGTVDQVLLHRDSKMIKELNSVKALGDKVTVIYLSTLSRMPSRSELQYGARVLNSDKQNGAGNLIWAILNTREFMFIE